MLTWKMREGLAENNAHEKVTGRKADTEEAGATWNGEGKTTEDYKSEFGSQG